MNKLTTFDLLKLSLRLMFIQSAWSSGSMQSEGFVYCIAPGLKKLFPDPEKRKRILKHYQLPINTHPFLASVLAGAALKMESEQKSTKTIVMNLRATMATLAAMGDPFFHAGLAPLAAVISSIIALLFGSVAGIVAILVIFNSVHLFFRFAGVFIGYRRGETALTVVGKWITPGTTQYIKTATALLAGLLLGLISVSPHFTTGGTRPILIPLIGAGCIALSFLLNNKRAIWVYVMPAIILALLALEVIVNHD